ncbi:tail fiber assembly chaperone [Phage vB_KsaM-C1]|nr:tail fiber assembly chaperone [Phage vB_KsaM-C1]
MKYYFSPQKNIFVTDINKSVYESSGNWPEDLTEVDYQTFVNFTGNPPQGKTRGTDSHGFPKWVKAPKEEMDFNILRNVKMAEAAAHIEENMWMLKSAAGLLSGNEMKNFKVWVQYIEALKNAETDLPEQPSV